MKKTLILSFLFLLSIAYATAPYDGSPGDGWSVDSCILKGPPSAITNLSALASTVTRGVVLTWTAPSDGGSPAYGYDLRMATATFTNADWDASWVSAVLNEPTPAAPGTTQTMTVSGLTSGVTYYFRLKSFDAALTMSAISDDPVAWACVGYIEVIENDFSSGVGSTRWAYESTALDIPSPVAGTEFISEQYTGIAYEDAAHGVSSGTASEIIAQRFLFKATDSASITKISVSWLGWNEAPLGTAAAPSLYIWNYNSNGWTLLDTGSASGSDQTMAGEITSNTDYYISNGSCNIKVDCPDPGTNDKRSRIHSNYVNVQFNYDFTPDTTPPAAATSVPFLHPVMTWEN